MDKKQENNTEMPIEVVSLSKIKHQKWNKGEKADVCVCGKENFGWSKEIKCEECGEKCYYSGDEDNQEFKKENIKKICLKCCLTKYRKHLNEEQIKILTLSFNS
jgi:hypothetical protein